MESKFFEEVHKLEKKYMDSYGPIFDQVYIPILFLVYQLSVHDLICFKEVIEFSKW